MNFAFGWQGWHFEDEVRGPVPLNLLIGLDRI